MVKGKIYRHLIFWLASMVQGTILEYAWVHTIFTDQPQVRVILQAMVFNLAFMPARLFLTYYALSLVSTRQFRQRPATRNLALKLIGALLIAVVMHRLATAWYIIPHEHPEWSSYGLEQVFSPLWMGVSLLDVGYVAAIAVAFRLFRLRNAGLHQEKELVKEKLETELKYLKNQIHPHFLFNTLNNIYALARKRSEETAAAVMKLAKLLRYMLYKSSDDTITIGEEISILENYVELEKMRYNNRLQLCFKKQIDDESAWITPLILLPFIENAFKHGASGTVEQITICISLAVEKGRLAFRVKNSCYTDSGKPIIENIGLKNVRRQLELCYDDFSLDISNLNKEFIVDLKINLHSHGKL